MGRLWNVIALVIACCVTEAFATRVPLYVTYNPDTVDYFYTTSTSARDFAVSEGYVNQGIAFYVEDSGSTGALPFQRFWKYLPQTDHFYTINASEASAIQANGWTPEGNEGYVYQTQVAGSTPMYRFSWWDTSTNNVAHYYTTDQNYQPALTGAAGWSNDGTWGYVFSAPADTPQAVKDPECLRNVSNLFTVGGQYVDPNNGVLNNSYSMLSRWQGSSFNLNAVNYDLSQYTAFGYSSTVGSVYGAPPTVTPVSQWQRGVQPESAGAATPGVQLYCNGGGMLINTWQVPHVAITGGGYNDMFGYQWGDGFEPYAFEHTDGSGTILGASQLMLQANLDVHAFYGYRGTSEPRPERRDPDGQVSLFAYIIDMNRPNLHAIAVVVNAYDSSAAAFASPGDADGYVRWDYASGVAFASATFNKSTAYTTTDPVSSISVKIPYPTYTNPSSSAPFFRIRITPANWLRAITDINKQICGAADCGTSGYTASIDLRSYRIKYAGIIGEVSLANNDNDGTVNNESYDQASIGINFHDFGIYRAY